MTGMSHRLSRAALAGAATGGRTVTGLAALALTSPPDAVDQPDRTLTTGIVKSVIIVAAIGELVADKLPGTPSRLAAPGIGGRIVAAAATGVIVARRSMPRPGRYEILEPVNTDPADATAAPDTATTVGCGAVAVGAAVASAWLGVRWRALAGPNGAARQLTALVEDATVIGLAAAAARS